eukprot:269292-Pelagomonas_calceolata.AAC.4
MQDGIIVYEGVSPPRQDNMFKVRHAPALRIILQYNEDVAHPAQLAHFHQLVPVCTIIEFLKTRGEAMADFGRPKYGGFLM